MSSFENLRIVDNFYQTSLYYPMPTVVISTLAEDGSTSLGPYSLIAPYYVAGKGYYAMLLNCRNSSNKALRVATSKAANGSSSSNNSGSVTNARARHTRCPSPPDKRLACRPAK